MQLIDTKEFFDLVFGDGEGMLCLALLNDKREPSLQHFLAWPSQAEEAMEYVAEHSDKDLYFSATLFNGPNARRSSVKWTRVVYGDADNCPVDSLRVCPSIVVHTSTDKTHVYWLLSDSTDPNVAEAFAHGVSDAHPKATTGFDNGWAANKLLRVPGTANTNYTDENSEKYDPKAEAFEVWAETTGEEFTLAEFEEHYRRAETRDILTKDMGELPTYADALNSLTHTSGDLMKLINKRFDKGSAGSEALFLLQQELFRLGATDEACFVICKKSGLNKFEREGRTNADELLWNDVLRARAKSDMVFREASEDQAVTVTVQAQPRHKSIDFLTKEEKAHLPKTFIDEFTTWAASKTDAAQQYHVASAFTILSTIFSDFGHACPKFGRLPLNLWFMVLGDTTRSRKSTTRSQMLKTLHALEDEEEGYKYDLGSDFTGEGLTTELLQRANRSSLVHLDEVQDFIDSLDKKSYLAGLRGQMTELYDGHVNGKLRASGTNKAQSSANIALTMYMMGIRDAVADVLTVKDFQSGFLTRFIYVEAEPPPRTAQSDYIAQADATERIKDFAFDNFVENLYEARLHWEDLAGGAQPTIPVPCAPEAWERLNKFIRDVLDEAEGTERSEIIQAASQRLSLSILKAATLIAMSQCKDEVELTDMLAAINYCGSWFTHMVNMANKVSESGWTKRIRELEELAIAVGGSIEWERAYRHFKSQGVKPREFMELVNALEEAGQATVVWENPEATKKGKRFIDIVTEAK